MSSSKELFGLLIAAKMDLSNVDKLELKIHTMNKIMSNTEITKEKQAISFQFCYQEIKLDPDEEEMFQAVLEVILDSNLPKEEAIAIQKIMKEYDEKEAKHHSTKVERSKNLDLE